MAAAMQHTASPALVLYHAWASTCSQKVRLALAEKGLDYDSRVVNLRRFEHLSDAFLAINPDAMVPVLLHGGFLVTESSVINDYLDDMFPQPPLRPADAQGRARVGMWCRFIDDVPSPAIKKPSFQRNMRPYLLTLAPHVVDDAARRMPSRATADRWRSAAHGGIAPAELAQAHADLQRTLDRMQQALAQSRWLAGDAYSLADINMAPFVLRLSAFDDHPLADRWPLVAAWLQRLMQRPAWPRAQMVGQPSAAVADVAGVAGVGGVA